MLEKFRYIAFLAVFFCHTAVYAFEGYGVNTYRLSELSGDEAKTVFELLEKAGIRWVRIGFRWDEIESEKGVYDLNKSDRLVEIAQKHNIKVLGLIGRTPEWASGAEDAISPPKNIEDWKDFVGTLVTRYKGKITLWEVWNEPDIKKFWKGSPEEYILLLKTAYQVIKELDPSIKILSAGLDGNAEKGTIYLDKLLSLGMADYADIIAFHPYGKTPEKSLDRIKNFMAIMERHGVKKPLWLTEIGWQTGGIPKGVSIVNDEETKALYLKEAFSILKPYAAVIFWFNVIGNPGAFGLMGIDNDKQIRLTPAYNAYKDMTRGGTSR